MGDKDSDSRSLKKKLNDPDYMGQDADPKLKHGPVMKRRCTDCLCYIIFLAFVVGMFVAAGYGWTKGDVSKLLASWRDQNTACGHGTQQGFSYLYIIPKKSPSDPTFSLSDLKGDDAKSYCVKSCPKTKNQSLQCSATATCDQKSSYQSKGFLGRFCIPEGDEYIHFYDSLTSIFFNNSLSTYVQDITKTWQVMLIVVGIAIVVGFLYLLLVYCCAAPVIWLSIFGSIGASAFFGWYYYDRASAFSQSTDHSETSFKALGIGLWVISGLILIICCCCYDKIRLAVAVVKAAAQFVFQTKRLLCHPIFLAIAIGLWYAVWLVGAVFIFSVGTLSMRGEYPIAEVQWDNTTRYAMLYYFFGLLWINAFFIAMFQFTIAVSAATWYFSYGTDDSGARVCKGICWGMGYHAGSLAFGSFILALIWMIRIVFEYWRKKMESLAPGDNKCMKCMICMVRCCLDCLNRCIKFINRNAYIQIALTSKSFCFAAIDAFFLILRNIARFGITHAVSAMFLFLGKVVIAGGSTFCGYLLVQYWIEKNTDLNNGYVPLFIFFLISYVISTIILSVYSMGANTILQCFLLDEELNKNAGGANHRPPAMEGLVKEIKK